VPGYCSLAMSKSELEVFADEIRNRRLALGLSQEDLAERAKLHRNSVGLVERGKHSLGLLALLRLADALGVNASELLSIFDKPREISTTFSDR